MNVSISLRPREPPRGNDNTINNGINITNPGQSSFPRTFTTPHQQSEASLLWLIADR